MKSSKLTHSLILISSGIALAATACSAADDGSVMLPSEYQDNQTPAVQDGTPREIAVTGVTYEGSICPPESILAGIDDGIASVSILGDRMVVLGPGATGDCKIEVDLSVPEGWSFSGTDFQYRGFTDANMRLRTQYSFGSGPTVSFDTAMSSEDFEYEERLWDSKTLWSPCTGTHVKLTINLELMNGTSSESDVMSTLDTLDFPLDDLGGMRFKRCGDSQVAPLRKAKSDEQCAGFGGIECVDGLSCDFSNNYEWRTGTCVDPSGEFAPGEVGMKCGGAANKLCEEGLECWAEEGLLGQCVDPKALFPGLECGEGKGQCAPNLTCRKYRLDEPDKPDVCVSEWSSEGDRCKGVYDLKCEEGLVCEMTDPSHNEDGYLYGHCIKPE